MRCLRFGSMDLSHDDAKKDDRQLMRAARRAHAELEDMSRLSGLPSSCWDDESPSAAGEEWDEEFYAENEAGGEWSEELHEHHDGSYSACVAHSHAAALQADAEHRASVYRDVFVPSLTSQAAANQGKPKKSGRTNDLTRAFFAALELDRNVSDVAEEIQSLVVQAEHRAASQAVSFVVERLVAAVELDTMSGERQQQYDIDTQRKPMYVLVFFHSRKPVTLSTCS
jgi:hypothetical protein